MFNELDLDLKNSTITFNGFTEINQGIPLINQLELLKEDLLQIEVGSDLIIDVGFYPEFSAEGEFKILLIKNSDWENPSWSAQTRDLNKLPLLIQEAIDKSTK
jgi:hypothetical protein